MKKAKWMKKLNRRELDHLTDFAESGRATLKGLKANLQWQVDSNTPCSICEGAARKLGIPLPSPTK